MKAWIASLLLRVLARTWNVSIEGRLPTGPCVVAFWHGEMLPVLSTFRALRPVVLVSPSTDGALLQRILRDWGYSVVSGSSSRGGREALKVIVDKARDNVSLITPDGPRGPAHVAKAGAVVAAHRAGVPLILVRMRATRVKVFHRSWDRFQLPLPHSHITLHISTPIEIPPHATREEVGVVIDDVTQQLHRLGSIQC